MRALMPVRVEEKENGDLLTLSSELKSDFIEGPCLCVRKILELIKPKESTSSFGIKDLVG